MVDLGLLNKLDFSGVAVTAVTDENGVLSPVGGALEKLSTAAYERSFPRIHTVVVAKDQPLDNIHLVRDPHNPKILKDPHSDFHVLRAESIVDAVALLTLNANTRWGGIDCILPPRKPDFVGRLRLKEEVRRFIDRHESGYLVLVGGMGKGKSTFLAELIHDQRDRDKEHRYPIYHIIDSHLSSTGKPESIASCLYNRLRRKHAFLEPDEWAPWKVEEKLETLLKYLSSSVLKDGQREVLYIDAADQAEESGRVALLPGTLRPLPPGVICVITSRPPLSWLRTKQAVEVWEMDNFVDDRTDVKAYLEQRAPHFSPPLSKDFIEQIVTQPDPPVYFTVVTRLRQLEDHAESALKEQEISTDPGLGVAQREKLNGTDAHRQIAKAKRMSERKFLKKLGVLAVAVIFAVILKLAIDFYRDPLPTAASQPPVASDRSNPATVPDGPGASSIEFTFIPPLGSFQNLKGRVLHVDPAAHRVVVYIEVNGQWWVKPFDDAPLTMIASDGSFVVDITTGGSDEKATRIAVYLIRAKYRPPVLQGSPIIPAELDKNSVAKAEVNRSS